ncbi:MAG: DUF6962 family protein, partial [Eubacteriales bacterium]
MITSPPELFTALTDLLAVPFAIYFLLRCIRIYKKTGKYAVLLWATVFAFLSVSSLLGFTAHFFVFPSESIKQGIWIPLSFTLCATATFLCAEAAVELFGEKYIKRAVTASSVLLVIGFAAMMTGRALKVKYILIFVFYAIIVIVSALVMYIIAFAKYKRRHFIYYFIACAIEAAGAVFQITRNVVINIGVLIDYNSIYHIMMIISLFPFFIGCKKYAEE